MLGLNTRFRIIIILATIYTMIFSWKMCAYCFFFIHLYYPGTSLVFIIIFNTIVVREIDRSYFMRMSSSDTVLNRASEQSADVHVTFYECFQFWNSFKRNTHSISSVLNIFKTHTRIIYSLQSLSRKVNQAIFDNTNHRKIRSLWNTVIQGIQYDVHKTSFFLLWFYIIWNNQHRMLDIFYHGTFSS